MSNEIYHMYWDVGAHSSFCRNITPTISQSINMGMYSCQFFMGSPKSYTRQFITPSDIKSTQKLIKRFPMNVFTHFPYIASLNGSVKDLAWSGNLIQDEKTNNMLKGLEYELSVVSNFNKNRSGVVIHPGSYKDCNIGLDTVAKTINKINFTDNGRLVLENCAGEGSKLCKDFVEIARVMDGIDSSKKENIGVCVDTCHIFASGIYNLKNCNEVDRMFFDFDRYIGLNKFTLLHLNDSKTIFGSKKDRHELLGKGYIWEDSFESLIYLLNKCKENGIPMVLETVVEDMLTLYSIQP
jgi:deoxyribonuclease-4